MKRLFLWLALLTALPASADWTSIECTQDIQSNSPGLIVSSAKSCGGLSLCIVRSNCSFVDSDALKKYGGVEKIPLSEIARVSIIAQSTGICLAENGHCPAYRDCIGNEPKS